MTDPELPSHASPMIAPIARPSSAYLTSWSDLQNHSQPSTPGIPPDLLSPQFTPPSTPGANTPLHDGVHKEPKSTPVDTSAEPVQKQPRLLERLPVVECVVRARIPTTSGAEMFLHLYQNDVDNKEHLAIVFGNSIRSKSLDDERPGETEMDRMIRGAYTGRLRPGRVSSRIDQDKDGELSPGVRRKRNRSGSALKNVVLPGEQDSIVEELPIQKDPTQSVAPLSQQDLRPPSPIHSHNFSLKPPLVRIHSECYTGETAWSARCDCGEQLDEAARLMSQPQHHIDPLTGNRTPIPDSAGGVIVYLRQEGRGIGLASKLKAYNLQDLGNDTVEANLLLRHPADARSYALATSILCDLGLGGERGIRLLTNNPDKVRAVEGPERQVHVRERVAMVPLSWKTGGKGGVQGRELEAYLQTKIGRMGHMIQEEEEGEVLGGGGRGGVETR